jgi:tRNA threonylcarbamoyl adenosine modification protein (Sua5/YciO/YrdC/YwlC family)
VQNPKRKTTGIRVPNHHVCLALLEALGNPIISTSAHVRVNDEDEEIVEDGQQPMFSQVDLYDHFDKLVDIIIDTAEEPTYQVSTILDLTDEEPVIIRRGLGWEALTAWV